jgi:hypothetical protein
MVQVSLGYPRADRHAASALSHTFTVPPLAGPVSWAGALAEAFGTAFWVAAADCWSRVHGEAASGGKIVVDSGYMVDPAGHRPPKQPQSPDQPRKK